MRIVLRLAVCVANNSRPNTSANLTIEELLTGDSCKREIAYDPGIQSIINYLNKHRCPGTRDISGCSYPGGIPYPTLQAQLLIVLGTMVAPHAIALQLHVFVSAVDFGIVGLAQSYLSRLVDVYPRATCLSILEHDVDKIVTWEQLVQLSIV